MKGGETNMLKKIKGVVVGVAAFAGSAVPSFALTTTDVETAISGAQTSVETIAVAVLVVLAGITAYRLIRRVM